MNDAVAEKLVQKVINMLEEMSDLNIQVRRLTPTQETLNRNNERIDAILGAIKQIENGISSDEKRIAALEKQTQSVQDTLNALKEAMGNLTKKADGINADINIANQNTISAERFNKSRFEHLENNLVIWSESYKSWVIALTFTLIGFIIVVLFQLYK